MDAGSDSEKDRVKVIVEILPDPAVRRFNVASKLSEIASSRNDAHEQTGLIGTSLYEVLSEEPGVVALEFTRFISLEVVVRASDWDTVEPTILEVISLVIDADLEVKYGDSPGVDAEIADLLEVALSR